MQLDFEKKRSLRPRLEAWLEGGCARHVCRYPVVI